MNVQDEDLTISATQFHRQRSPPDSTAVGAGLLAPSRRVQWLFQWWIWSLFEATYDKLMINIGCWETCLKQLMIKIELEVIYLLKFQPLDCWNKPEVILPCPHMPTQSHKGDLFPNYNWIKTKKDNSMSCRTLGPRYKMKVQMLQHAGGTLRRMNSPSTGLAMTSPDMKMDLKEPRLRLHLSQQQGWLRKS